MAGVKGKGSSQGYFAGEGAFFEGAAAIIAQKLGDPAKLIDETGDAGVSDAHHRPTVLDAAEDGVGQVLARTSGAQEPTVVGDVDQEVGSVQNEMASEFAQGVLEANERGDAAAVIRKLENCVIVAGIEVTGHLVADDIGKQWEAMTKRDVFAEGNEVDFAIELRRKLGRDEQSGIRD